MLGMLKPPETWYIRFQHPKAQNYQSKTVFQNRDLNEHWLLPEETLLAAVQASLMSSVDISFIYFFLHERKSHSQIQMVPWL